MLHLEEVAIEMSMEVLQLKKGLERRGRASVVAPDQQRGGGGRATFSGALLCLQPPESGIRLTSTVEFFCPLHSGDGMRI